MPVYHPLFVHAPIALLAFSVILDLFGYFLDNDRLRTAGWWGLFGAALGGVAAAGTGLWDMYHVSIEKSADRFVEFHMWVGFALLASAAVLAVWRGVIYFKSYQLKAAYLAAALLVLVLVGFQNWLGGEIVYGYGVGVAPTGQSSVSTREAQAPLKKVEQIFGPFEASHVPNGEGEKAGGGVKSGEPSGER